MKTVQTEVKDNNLVVTIPAEYLANAFEMGVTTGVTGKVNDKQAMLEHFEREVKSGDNDSLFGRFVDGVCESALEDGELFVDSDDYADNDCY